MQEPTAETLQQRQERRAQRARNAGKWILSEPRGMDFLDVLLDRLCADGFSTAGMSVQDIAMAHTRRSVADEIRGDLRTLDPEGLAAFESRRIKLFADKLALAREEARAELHNADDTRGFGKGAT